MPILVEDAAKTIASVDAEAGGGGRTGDRCGQCAQWPDVSDSLMRSVGVVELLELVQCVEQVPLVPDQGPVEQFAAAGLHGPLDLGLTPHRQLHLIRVIGTDVSG